MTELCLSAFSKVHHFQIYFTRFYRSASLKMFATLITFLSSNLDIIFSMKTVKLQYWKKRILLSTFKYLWVQLHFNVCCRTQSRDSLTHYWLSRLRLTFTCHIFCLRPTEDLKVGLYKVNVLLNALSSLHTFSL